LWLDSLFSHFPGVHQLLAVAPQCGTCQSSSFLAGACGSPGFSAGACQSSGLQSDACWSPAG